ncbi:MAG: hypothetical protein NTV43_02485 [Methylococcales bacterium]|nr:hypothetical protein [Methylococcales bacterium]
MFDLLRRNDILIQWLAGIGIPVALVFSSWLITTSSERTKVDSEYVRIALSILATEQKSDDNAIRNDQLALRRWAIRLLNKKSPEKFTDEEQNALLKMQLNSSNIIDHTLQSIGLGSIIDSTKVTTQRNLSKK